MRIALLLLTFLFASIGLFAQEASSASYTITGQLLGEGEDVSFANVLLMTAADSVLAKAELSEEDGSFSVSVDSGAYFLQVVMLGYRDYLSAPMDVSEDLNLGSIQIEAFANTLETAVVTSKKPFLEQQAGKMIVNVENSITGQTGSATQLLRKVPGLIVRGDNVSMAGSPGVTILIDGKPTRYMDINALLREMPASDIAKIEVVTQPGAAYDAEGSGGVINIILKKNVKLGTNGSVQMGIGRGDFNKFNTSLRLSNRAGKLNTYGSASYRRGSGFDRLELDRIVGDVRILQDNISPFLPNSMNARGGLDYDLSDRVVIGVSARYRHTVDENIGDNSTLGFEDSEQGSSIAGLTPLFSLSTINDKDRTRRSGGIDSYYRFNIDTSGRKLEADLSFGTFDSDGINLTKTQLNSGDFTQSIDDIQNIETGNTKIGAAQVDYTHPIFVAAKDNPKGLTLRTGLKYSLADIDADLQSGRRSSGSEGAFVNDAGISNRFLYNENIGAAYVSFDAKIGELTFNAGLRYEYTNVKANNVTIDSISNRDYDGFFPSFGISVPLTGELGINGAYSYRLRRPNYNDLNPFITYLDPLTFERGNTELTPSFTHNSQINLTYEGQPFFRLAYERTTDVITIVTEQNTVTGITEKFDDNLDSYTRYGGHLFAPLSFIPKTNGYIGGMAYYNLYESEFLGGNFDQGDWSFTGFFNATVELPLKLKAEVGGWIQSGGQEGIIQSGTLYGSSIGLERKFMDEQLRVAVSLEDPIFNPYDGRIDFQDQRIDIINSWEQPIVMLNLTYKFGNRYLKSKDRRASAARDALNRASD